MSAALVEFSALIGGTSRTIVSPHQVGLRLSIYLLHFILLVTRAKFIGARLLAPRSPTSVASNCIPMVPYLTSHITRIRYLTRRYKVAGNTLSKYVRILAYCAIIATCLKHVRRWLAL